MTDFRARLANVGALRAMIVLGAVIAWSSAASVASACPDAPPAPNVSTNNCGGIFVSWPFVPGATGYDVQRVGNSTTVQVLTDYPGNNFVDTTVVPGVEYSYRVRALQSTPFTCPSGMGPFGPYSGQGMAPGTPSAPSIGNISTVCQITLGIGTSQFSTSVQVYRATTTNLFDAVVVATANIPEGGGGPVTDPTPTTFGVTYYYWARSLGPCGPGPFAGPAARTLSIGVPASIPVPSAEPGTECGSIRFSWPEVPGALGYTFNIVPSGVGSAGNTPDNEVIYYSAGDGLPRTIFVRAFGGCGETSFSLGATSYANALPGAAIGSAPASVAVDTGDFVVIGLSLIDIQSLIGVRWHKDGVPLTNSVRITGAMSPTLTIYNCTPADAGEYRLQVQTTCGVGQSASAVLGVRASCEGDFDGSGMVDLIDLLNFVSEWSANLGQNCP